MINNFVKILIVNSNVYIIGKVYSRMSMECSRRSTNSLQRI